MLYSRYLIFALTLCATSIANAQTRDLEETYRFLISDREAGGALYTATAGALRGQKLPLSFYATPEYWGEYVCKKTGNTCAVVDTYNATDFTLTPQRGPAGDLQTERVNVHAGTNIYDAAVWQIAVVLGQVENRFGNARDIDAYSLVTNQNRLLKEGYSGNTLDVRADANRAITAGNQFRYNGHTIVDGKQAYSFRMLGRSWLASDPFVGTRYESLVTAKGLPFGNKNYQAGKVTWTDWKPITGENAWAFLLGPLHAAHIHYVKGERKEFVPFNDLSIQNALAVLPTFAAMQSPIGGVYHVPSGTLSNQGDQLTNPYQVSVENNASLYAGLKVLQSTLRAELQNETSLTNENIAKVNAALTTINAMINGGQVGKNKPTAGLLIFFRKHAWRDNEFVQGGLANDPSQKVAWIPTLKPRAVDANTWTVAALGPNQIDQWFGIGAAYMNWQQVKSWGA